MQRRLSGSMLASLALVVGASTVAGQDAKSPEPRPQETKQGFAPRAKAEDYAVKGQFGDGILAASLVPADQVKHIFAFDISNLYVVFEVACYPNVDKPMEISRDDFVVKTGKKGELAHQADAATVASVLQQQNTPRPPSRTTPAIGGGATVGYESGTDPYTGRKVHGVYTGAEVSAETDGRGRPDPPYNPKPGSQPEDRRLLEAQLNGRSLPEGRVDHPVAGYLFFPKSAAKTGSNGEYHLQYLVDDQGVSSPQTIELSVPAKNR